MKSIRPKDILIDREKRVYFQEEVRKKYKSPMISMRVNYPGINKNNDVTKNIAEIMSNKLKDMFKGNILYENFKYTGEGPVFTIIVKDIAEEIKKKTVSVEEKHILGRCVDIDVYDEFGKGLSRRDLNMPSRKCFICEDYAQNCVRSRKHSLEEIIKFVEDRLNMYLQKNI